MATSSAPQNHMSRGGNGVQTTDSFHSVSSIDSSAEMSKYFPDAQTPSLSPFRHQQVVEGQAQSTATSNTVASSNTNTNTVNAGPYIPVSVPTAVQRLSQPIRAPNMAQQQRPVRPPGIPSYSSQIEGLSVSQAVVNDVLVDLQTKVINETLQQYHDESSNGAYMESLAPIYIRAPQPTIILQSDLHRLRAELGNRVRPPVIHRHPAAANQFQQHQFQQNTFQVPRFPAPPQQQIPPECYGDYRNMVYANSDEYKTTTTGDEYRKESDERLYHQAEPTMLNADNINDNVHSAFNLQGLSTTSFDSHASPYDSSSSLSNLEEQQQGNEETLIMSSQNIHGEDIGTMDNMFSRPGRPRQEITFDIDNCIYRCFEAHRQRVARRRAARQARKARRNRQTAQKPEQAQPLYYADQYQNFTTQPTRSSFATTEQTQWQQQPTNTSTSVHTTQEPYIPSNTYDYTTHQSVPITTNLIQQQQHQQPYVDQRQQKTSYDYSSQLPYSFSSTGATVPSDVQYLTSEYYQQQNQPSTQYTSGQDIYTQPSTTYDYNTGASQTQLPSYDYQNIAQSPYQYTTYNADNVQQQQQQQQPSVSYSATIPNTYTTQETFDYTTTDIQAQYPYDMANINQQQTYDYTTSSTTGSVPLRVDVQQAQEKQTTNYLNQADISSNYYEQQSIPVVMSQGQGSHGQPTGTFEYTRESYQSQEPIYNYTDVEQTQDQPLKQDTNETTATHLTSTTDTQRTEEKQPIPIPVTQIQETHDHPSGTFEYTRETYESQKPISDHDEIKQDTDQKQATTESSQVVSTSTHEQDQATSIPVAQGSDVKLHEEQANDTKITSTKEDETKQPPHVQEPVSDNYSTERFIEQQEKGESFSVNDYIKQFESKSQPQQSGGPSKSSDERQSTRSTKTTPFVVEQNVDIKSSQGSAQTYDLQNYTNETLTSETSQQSQSTSSLLTEEDQRHLLQETTTTKPIEQSLEKTEQHYEKEASIHDTNSSLPPPPTAEGTEHQQGSYSTSASDFPPPPTTLDRQAYQIKQQRTNRSIPSIIPSTDQASIYTTGEQLQTTSVDHGADENISEAEELFDLRKCITKCYEKYREAWNKEAQAKYEEQIATITSHNEQESNISIGRPYDHHNDNEIHYIDGWSQTLSHDSKRQPNAIDHTYEQTKATKRDLSSDSRGQQTIEYSPPLITQTRQVISTLPQSESSSFYKYTTSEQPQQQKQTMFDHTLPLPHQPSFNDTSYQPNFDFSSQITDQPRQYENIPFDKYEEQQRLRAHSEPASIKQDSVASVPPQEQSSLEITEQQPRRAASIPMINPEQGQTNLPSVRLIDNGRAYETDSTFRRYVPRIDPKTGLCLVPCPDTQKYAHLPSHLRPELFCIELPPVSSLPTPLPPAPPPPPAQPVQDGRWCVRCCCVPGKSIVKKVVYRQAEEEQQQQQQQQESELDYASVIDQMATTISVRYGNEIMEDIGTCVSGGYHEQLRIIDFPVYISGQNDPTLKPLVPTN